MAELDKIALGGTTYNLKDSGARQGLSDLETAQRALASDQASLPVYTQGYRLTSDATFLRYKSYFAYDSVSGEYTKLILGTDYNFGDEVDNTSVYEINGVSLADMRNKLNGVTGVINTLIPAHRAAAPAVVEEPQESGT